MKNLLALLQPKEQERQTLMDYSVAILRRFLLLYVQLGAFPYNKGRGLKNFPSGFAPRPPYSLPPPYDGWHRQWGPRIAVLHQGL